MSWSDILGIVGLIVSLTVCGIIIFSVYHPNHLKKLTEEDIQKENPYKGVLKVIDDEDGRHLFLNLTSDIDVKQDTIVFVLSYINLVNYSSYSQKKNGEFVKL